MDHDLWTPDDVDELEVVDMDLTAVAVELLDRGADGLVLALSDGDAVVHLQVRRNSDAWLAVERLAGKIKAVVPEVRGKTLGYQAEHNAHTGPGVRGPIHR